MNEQTNQAVATVTHFTAEVQERFWKKVNRDGPVPDPAIYGDIGPCWQWLAGTEKGYGRISILGRNERAYRIAWRMQFGDIPSGMCVCHKCDNTRCVNWNHCFLGTMADNTADRHAKGRTAKGETSGAKRHPEKIRRGEQAGRAILTANDVVEMRRLHAAGGISYAELGRRFPVHWVQCRQIIMRKYWKHVP